MFYSDFQHSLLSTNKSSLVSLLRTEYSGLRTGSYSWSQRIRKDSYLMTNQLFSISVEAAYNFSNL
jgi:hypothetical protein